MIITQDQHAPKLPPGHCFSGHVAGVGNAIGEANRYNHHLHKPGWNLSRPGVFLKSHSRYHDRALRFGIRISQISSMQDSETNSRRQQGYLGKERPHHGDFPSCSCLLVDSLVRGCYHSKTSRILKALEPGRKDLIHMGLSETLSTCDNTQC